MIIFTITPQQTTTSHIGYGCIHCGNFQFSVPIRYELMKDRYYGDWTACAVVHSYLMPLSGNVTETHFITEIELLREIEMEVKREIEVPTESGFSPSTGIYSSKWDTPLLPQTPFLSLPSFLLSKLPLQILSKPAFVDSKSGNSITYGELHSLTNTVAYTLHSLGIKKGDVVFLVSPNFLHFPVLVLGVMSIDAIFSTANPLHTRLELQSQIQDTNPKLVLTTPELQYKLNGLTSRPLVLIQDFLKQLVHSPEGQTLEVQINQEDTAALMYSSGTTGKNKAVGCSHRNFIAMSCQLRHVWDVEGEAHEETYMCVIQMFHMFGLSVFVCGVLAVRSTAVILDKYSLEKMLKGVEQYRVTRLPVVPPMVVHLVRLQDGVKRYDLGSLKEVICSGAPLGTDHMERFRKCFPKVRLSQCYGLTETSGPITLCDGVGGMCHESIGGLIPSYFQNKKDTSFAIDNEGWLQTGDLCFIDAFGLVYIVDRIKELIKYKAYQVAPAELEEVLSSHPDIIDAAVIPYPNEEAGEIPMACVVRSGTNKVEEDGIISFVANKVASYKKVRKVVFVDSIPRSPSGKILRRHLKASTLRQHLHLSSKL
ncbi:hypothetical protein GIB67_024646 [Kingdonia uniflora]|uniref:4-coumarate--CoA ligase n=1 Tax=Kingdonia uniflora TaxID=39325 RepID=A0A7J7LPD0_9MAGN|nr:hypothetical protein GIB67_024646 [Kingdonia uniflora]